MKEERVAVVGLGLIGGSIGAALRQSGAYVRGHDVSARHRDIALERGLVDDLGSGLRDTLDGATLVVLATPTLRTVDLLPHVDLSAPSEAVILDTASAKRVVVDAMAVMVGARRMVGGHPLAGKEISGPREADPHLFRDRTFCLCPSEHTSAETVERAESLVREIGARPLLIEPAEHDRVLAATSHLPQLLATVLAGTARAPRELTGPGYWDMTRLAAGESAMWRDVLLANADEVVAVGREYSARLTSLLDAIETGDVSRIEEAFVEGRQVRAAVEAGA